MIQGFAFSSLAFILIYAPRKSVSMNEAAFLLYSMGFKCLCSSLLQPTQMAFAPFWISSTSSAPFYSDKGLLWHIEAELSSRLFQGHPQHHRLVPQHLRRLASLLPHLQQPSNVEYLSKRPMGIVVTKSLMVKPRSIASHTRNAADTPIIT